MKREVQDCECGDNNAPVADSEEIVKDNEEVSDQVHHIVNWIENLTVEDLNWSREDVENLSNRCNVEEHVDGSFQDLSDCILVHISTNPLIHACQDIVLHVS